MILLRLPDKYSRHWPTQSDRLFLNFIDIGEILQILITVVLLLHILLYFISDSLFNFWILGNLIDDHLEEVRCCVRSSKEKGGEFCEKLIFPKLIFFFEVLHAQKNNFYYTLGSVLIEIS